MYPSVYTPWYTHSRHHRPHFTAVTGRSAPPRRALLTLRAVRLGGFRIVLFQLKTGSDTSRLHGARRLSTSVCQAKREKCARTEKYYFRTKELLPEIRSLFSFPENIYPSLDGSVGRDEKRSFRLFSSFLSRMFFQAKYVFFSWLNAL